MTLRPLMSVLFGLVLVSRAVPSESDYLDIYARGCRALQDWHWGRAAALFELAREQHPAPFGRPARWTGDNSLLYLPNYSLGVAYFGQGRYEAALQSWQRVENDWSIVSPRMQRRLSTFQQVVQRGREVYRDRVCSDLASLVEPAGSSSADVLAGVERIRTLCSGGRFKDAVGLMKQELKSRAGSSEGTPTTPIQPANGRFRRGDSEGRDEPVAFAQLVSDCEAPLGVGDNQSLMIEGDSPWRHGPLDQKLKEAVVSSASGQFGLSGFMHANKRSGPSSGRRDRTAAGTQFVAAQLLRGERVSDLRQQARLAYGERRALIIAPDYSNTPFPVIESSAAITDMRTAMKEWGFSTVDVMSGRVTKSEARKALDQLVGYGANSSFLKQGKSIPDLFWFHFIGHSQSLDDGDDGWLIASDSVRLNGLSRLAIEQFTDKAIDTDFLQLMSSRRPHHMIVSFESCGLGVERGALFQVPGRGRLLGPVWNDPALFVLMRERPGEPASNSAALTEAIADSLQRCTGVDETGVLLGSDLLQSILASAFEAAESDVPVLLKFMRRPWDGGDVVLVDENRHCPSRRAAQ